MKTKFYLILLLVITINLVSYSQTFQKHGAGVTIIIHGWNPDGSQPSWMQVMAKAIIARSGGNGQIGTITVTGSKGNLSVACSNWNFYLDTATSGEIVVLVNWTAVSNHLTTGVTAQEVAAAVAPKIYQSQNSQAALSELPIHLIGHSRGGGMVYEIAHLLGLQGIEVEQVTSLDPHPLTASDPQGLGAPFGPGYTFDTPIQIYENILYADNYYQNIKYPTGQNLSGAYNRLWTSLPGGYHNQTGYTYNILGANYDFSDHLNIILMYHGTIDLSTPVSNGQATMTTTERAWFNTYETSGQIAGFHYSRIIVGDRKSTDTPVASGDEIIAGYNNNSLLGGSGARATLTWTNAVWPNVITSVTIKNLTELSIGTQLIYNNDALQINYKYRSYTNASTVTFYIDTDRNPFNNNNVATIGSKNLSATGSTINQSNLDWTVSGLMSGTKYYVYAQISDGTHKRFQYLDYEFNFLCSANIPAITAKGGTICAGALQNIIADGASTYSWSNSLGSGVTKTVNPTTSTTYTVTGTDANNCTNTANAVVNVNTKPNVTAGGGTICAGDSQNITAGGASTYSWSNSLGIGVTKTVNLTTTTTYTVTGTDANNCTNTANAVVNVNAKPTVTAGGGTICAGNSQNITADGASTYSWSNSLGSGSTKTVNPTTFTTYTVTGTDTKNCTNTANAVVNVNAKPTVTAGGGTICAGDSQNITAGGVSTYSWSNSLGSGATKTVNPTTVTTYTVTGTDVNNCTNTANAVVNVNPLPETPTITQKPDTLTSSAINGNQWYNSSDSILNATNQIYIPKATDDYYVIVTSNGCSSNKSNTIHLVITGITKQSLNENISVYPNPVNDKLNILLNTSRSENFILEILNELGQNINTRIMNIQGNSVETIDISAYPSGIYFVKLQTANNTIVKKIIKQK